MKDKILILNSFDFSSSLFSFEFWFTFSLLLPDQKILFLLIRLVPSIDEGWREERKRRDGCVVDDWTNEWMTHTLTVDSLSTVVKLTQFLFFFFPHFFFFKRMRREGRERKKRKHLEEKDCQKHIIKITVHTSRYVFEDQLFLLFPFSFLLSFFLFPSYFLLPFSFLPEWWLFLGFTFPSSSLLMRERQEKREINIYI